MSEPTAFSWSIDGLYTDSGALKTKKELKEEPPVFLISDGEVELLLLLNKDVASEMFEGMKLARNAFYHVDSRPEYGLTNFGVKEKLKRLGEWITDHTLIAGFIATFIGVSFAVGILF